MGDGIHGHLALGTETRLYPPRLVLPEQDGDFDAADGARIADEVLRFEELTRDEVARHGEPCHATVIAHLDTAEHLTELGQGVAGTLLVEPVRDERGIRPRRGEFGGDAEGPRRRVGVAEGPGVGVNGREEIESDRGRDAEAKRLEKIEDHLARGRRGRIDPVDRPVASVVGMMIDVDHAASRAACPLEETLRAIGIGAVGHHDQLEALRSRLPD